MLVGGPATVPGVTATLSGPALIAPPTAVTLADGSYRFRALGRGVYDLVSRRARGAGSIHGLIGIPGHRMALAERVSVHGRRTRSAALAHAESVNPRPGLTGRRATAKARTTLVTRKDEAMPMKPTRQTDTRALGVAVFIVAGAFLGSVTSAVATGAGQTQPRVVNGSTTIDLASLNSIIDVDVFVIPEEAVVTINQPTDSSRLLIRVDGPVPVSVNGTLRWNGYLCLSSDGTINIDGTLNGQRTTQVKVGRNAFVGGDALGLMGEYH